MHTRRRLLEASSLIDDVFASTLASRIEPEAAIILADAALACPAASTGVRHDGWRSRVATYHLLPVLSVRAAL